MGAGSVQVKPITVDLKEGIEKALHEIGTATVEDIKTNSPMNTGAYSDGWTYDIKGNDVVIHNETRYQLSHLLEKGHAVNGKGGAGHVAGTPHIKPAYERAKRKFKSELEQIKIIVKQ